MALPIKPPPPSHGNRTSSRTKNKQTHHLEEQQPLSLSLLTLPHSSLFLIPFLETPEHTAQQAACSTLVLPMEIHFQQQLPVIAKPTKVKARGRGGQQGGSKFVGVRQRPSGRWVAEIKDTTQKIRMWLGTFETAEEAARAYDEAACLLRGSNTRTNFVPRAGASNSPLAARIRGLLHHKKLSRGAAAHPPLQPPPPSTFVPAASSAAAMASGTSPSSSTTTTSTVTVCSNVSSSSSGTTTTTTTTTTSSSTAAAPQTAISHAGNQAMDMAAGDVYRPCFGNGVPEFHLGTPASDLSWLFDSAGIDRLPPFTQEGSLEVPRHGFEDGDEGMSELERMKVERQISASLYAINGVHEYLEAVHDPSDALWDLPPLCQLFCQS